MTSKVKDLISRSPVIVEKGTSAIDAVKTMASLNMGSVIIADHGNIIGIITERDIIRALAKGLSITDPVEKLGTTGNLITVSENDSIYTAAEKMSKYNIRHLIVLDSEGKFRGIISMRDMIRESHVLKALSSISGEEFVGSD
jgi:CBS domain-containing protein